jgi:hypothetical protein
MVPLISVSDQAPISFSLCEGMLRVHRRFECGADRRLARGERSAAVDIVGRRRDHFGDKVAPRGRFQRTDLDPAYFGGVMFEAEASAFNAARVQVRARSISACCNTPKRPFVLRSATESETHRSLDVTHPLVMPLPSTKTVLLRPACASLMHIKIRPRGSISAFRPGPARIRVSDVTASNKKWT